jgi:hypothetical protein
MNIHNYLIVVSFPRKEYSSISRDFKAPQICVELSKKEYCIFFSQCIIIMYNKTSKSNRVSAHLHQPQNYLEGLGLGTGIIFISHTHTLKIDFDETF